MSTVQLVPMWRLTERMVRSTLVTACRLATSPTSTSPFLANATLEGVVRLPSALAMTVGSPPSRTETTELVVPRSIPTARDMRFLLLTVRVQVAPGWRDRFVVLIGHVLLPIGGRCGPSSQHAQQRDGCQTFLSRVRSTFLIQSTTAACRVFHAAATRGSCSGTERCRRQLPPSCTYRQAAPRLRALTTLPAGSIPGSASSCRVRVFIRLGNSRGPTGYSAVRSDGL